MIVESVKIENNKCTIVIPLEAPGTRSKGGEGPTYLIASTRGNQETSVQHNGKPLFVNVNVVQYVEPKDR